MTKSPEKEYRTPRKGERGHFCVPPWNSLPPLFFAHIFPFPRDHLGDKGGREREEEGVKLSWVVFPFPPLPLSPPRAKKPTSRALKNSVFRASASSSPLSPLLLSLIPLTTHRACAPIKLRDHPCRTPPPPRPTCPR